jgi:ABC-type Fe3+/spermidine/putrescine transport system ATPase subunit
MRLDVENLTYHHALCGAADRPDEAGGIEGVRLSVEPGEVAAVLGPSGAGKTTLLFLIAGFYTPAAGTVRFDGRTASDIASVVPPRRRGIGMVFQDLGLWPHLSVKDHLDFVLQAKGLARRDRERRRVELLDLVELTRLGRRLPVMLSGGEAQRLALARALAAEPRLLLLDEPLGGLDRSLRRRMLSLISQLHARSPVSTVYVTHDFDEAAAIAKHGIVLEQGRVAQAGSIEDLYSRPASSSVAALTGRVNLIEGTSCEEGRVRLRLGTYRAAFTAPPGTRVTVVLRPESIEAREEDGGRAIVRNCRFRGGTWELQATCEGEELTLDSRAPVGAGKRVHLLLREPLWGFVGSPAPGPEPPLMHTQKPAAGRGKSLGSYT